MVQLSNLEFCHDQFAFKVFNTNRELALSLSNKFPRHFRKKTDFLIHAVANVAELKKIPIFQTGELDLLWLQYQLDELYEIRSVIAHGSIIYSEIDADRINFSFDRVVRRERNSWRIERVEMTNGYLAHVEHTAFIIKGYIRELICALGGGSSWEDNYQFDKDVRESRRVIAEEIFFEQSSVEREWLETFPMLAPVE